MSQKSNMYENPSAPRVRKGSERSDRRSGFIKKDQDQNAFVLSVDALLHRQFLDMSNFLVHEFLQVKGI